MKDLVITEKFIKRELKVLLGCFIFAVLVDIVAVIIYKKPFYEVFQTIGYEIVITGITYAVLAVIRIVIYLITILFKKK